MLCIFILSLFVYHTTAQPLGYGPASVIDPPGSGPLILGRTSSVFLPPAFTIPGLKSEIAPYRPVALRPRPLIGFRTVLEQRQVPIVTVKTVPRVVIKKVVRNVPVVKYAPRVVDLGKTNKGH